MTFIVSMGFFFLQKLIFNNARNELIDLKEFEWIGMYRKCFIFFGCWKCSLNSFRTWSTENSTYDFRVFLSNWKTAATPKITTTKRTHMLYKICMRTFCNFSLFYTYTILFFVSFKKKIEASKVIKSTKKESDSIPLFKHSGCVVVAGLCAQSNESYIWIWRGKKNKLNANICFCYKCYRQEKKIRNRHKEIIKFQCDGIKLFTRLKAITINCLKNFIFFFYLPMDYYWQLYELYGFFPFIILEFAEWKIIMQSNKACYLNCNFKTTTQFN